MIGMLAEVHTAVHRESQANKQALNRRTLGGSNRSSGIGQRRGFKGF
jgi:hypothetical protein